MIEVGVDRLRYAQMLKSLGSCPPIEQHHYSSRHCIGCTPAEALNVLAVSYIVGLLPPASLGSPMNVG